jgi:hypothetical protein
VGPLPGSSSRTPWSSPPEEGGGYRIFRLLDFVIGEILTKEFCNLGDKQNFAKKMF